MTPFDRKYMTSYLIAIEKFALSLTFYEIFAKQIKCQKVWPWIWRSRSRIRKNWLLPFEWNCSIPYRWFFRILATWEHTFMQTGNTHTHLHTHTHKHTRAHTHIHTHTHTHVHLHTHTHMHTHTYTHMTYTHPQSAKQICVKSLVFKKIYYLLTNRLYLLSIVS